MREGTVLAGRYRLEKLLGRGGMGQVWQGVDQNLRRRVAIKLLLADLMTDERLAGQALRRFRREGEAAARLNHRNITAIHDLGEHRDDHPGGLERTHPFLVLEYLDGRDLRTLLDDAHPRGLPLEDVLDYGAQACDALAAAHSAGIVHRDIKPANLMLLSDGTLKVCDFGIARLHDATAGLSMTGVGIGTLAYMPPEQLDGRPIDHRADLYALGATLYHLLTGGPVFPADDLRALAYMHTAKTPDPPSARLPGIPPELDALITALLAKDPGQRPSTAARTAAGLRSLTRPETAPAPSADTAPAQDIARLRAQTEHEIAQVRARAEHEIAQLRALTERERDEILTTARRQADEIRAEARQLLEDSEAQRARAEAEFEIQLAARREEADRQDAERHLAAQTATRKLVAEAERLALSAEQRATKATRQAEQIITDAQAEADRIRTAAQHEVDELTRRRDSITAQLRRLRQIISDDMDAHRS